MVTEQGKVTVGSPAVTGGSGVQASKKAAGLGEKAKEGKACSGALPRLGQSLARSYQVSPGQSSW